MTEKSKFWNSSHVVSPKPIDKQLKWFCSGGCLNFINRKGRSMNEDEIRDIHQKYFNFKSEETKKSIFSDTPNIDIPQSINTFDLPDDIFLMDEELLSLDDSLILDFNLNAPNGSIKDLLSCEE